MVPQVALVTGGASGMGQIFALRMAKRGTKVAVLDMNEEGLEATARQSQNIHPYKCDTSDLENVIDTLKDVAQKLGDIDRLVNAAAIMPTAKLVDQSTELIHKLMAVNFGGTVNLTKSILPAMLKRKTGEVVVFGSTGGSVLLPDCGAYCATKAATNAYVEVLIEENRGRGVHIMLVCPGLVNTPLLKQATESSNPRSVRYAIEKNKFADPDFIIDEIEKGLEKRKTILLPGLDAKMVTWLRRFSPRLLWKIIHLSNKEKAIV